MYASDRALSEVEPPFIDGHAATWTARDEFELRDDARRFETWEFNGATRIGLGVAARYAIGVGLPSIWPRVEALATRLRDRLAQIGGVTVCDQGRIQCAIVTFVCAGILPESVKAALARKRINVSVIDASWTRIDMDARAIPAVVRASVHYYNTEEEIDALAGAVDELMNEPRQA